MFPNLDKLAAKAEALLDKLDQLMPTPPDNDWSAIAYRWQKRDGGLLGSVRATHSGALVPVAVPHVIHLGDLHDIDDQKERLVANTKQFVEGRTANNVLLTGARGTGKSSLVKAVLHRFARQGLRLIEVDRAEKYPSSQANAKIASLALAACGYIIRAHQAKKAHDQEEYCDSARWYASRAENAYLENWCFCVEL